MEKAKTERINEVSKTEEVNITSPPSPFQKLIDRKFGKKPFTSDQLNEYIDNLVEMKLMYQDYIPNPPMNSAQLYSKACSNDSLTLESWREQWLEQMATNAKNYDVIGNTIMSEYNKQKNKPVILAASGPSLKKNIEELAKNKNDMCLVSCCHNFAYFVDNGVKADYYVNLDAGEITYTELGEGGEKSNEYYWEKTKDYTLITCSTAYPKFLNSWKGPIRFFNVCPPDSEFLVRAKAILDFPTYFNVGGNTLGAVLYFSRAILAGGTMIFIGADFSFSYDQHFHSWDSPYDDKFAGLTPWIDVFGNKVQSWGSYINFKHWFDFIACGGKGGAVQNFINCTEGGILGAYPQGNIRQITQMTLREALYMHNLPDLTPGLMKEDSGNKLLF
jgi:hypothetical protein